MTDRNCTDAEANAATIARFENYFFFDADGPEDRELLRWDAADSIDPIEAQERAAQASELEYRIDAQTPNNIVYGNGKRSGVDGFVSSHRYPSLAHAAAPTTWRVASLQAQCIPVVGVEVVAHADGSVTARLHVAPSVGVATFDDGCWRAPGLEAFLGEPYPWRLTFEYTDDVLSQAHRIALSGIADADWFALVDDCVREAIRSRRDWIIPPTAIPCDALEAMRARGTPEARRKAEATLAVARRRNPDPGHA